MKQYNSLKDYIIINHLDVISKELYDYISATSDVEFKINDLKILTQSKIAFMPFDILIFSIGVSCEEFDADNNSVGIYYYNVMLTGNMSKHFSDLHVLTVEECTQESLVSETVMSLFGLPDITVYDFEDEADKVHSHLYAFVKKNEEHKYRFNPVRIKEKYKKSDNMHMWPADFDSDDVLGQIRFEKSTATIYDIDDPYMPYPNSPIPANTILLNVKYFRNEIGSDDIITAAHELVHWDIHRDYMKLLQFLDDSYKVMECKSVPLILNDNMSLKEKARWYAEWQANELAIRVALPRHFVKEAISEYEHCNNNCHHDGHYYENMIYKLAWDFNVPKEIMKMRLRHLGYDYANGTFVTVDDCIYHPFTFPQGTLKENETFVIDRENYEKLLKENEKFAHLISSGMYIYLGYVVCRFDSKYVLAIPIDNGIKFDLTDFAREHADECLIKFSTHSFYSGNKRSTAYIHDFFNKEEYSDKSTYYYSEKDNKNLSARMIHQIEAVKENAKEKSEDEFILIKMKTKEIDTFGKALTYVMDKFNHPKITKEVLAELLDTSVKTIQNWRNDHTKPQNVETVMLICLFCKTGPVVSRFLIEKSIGGIPDEGLKKIAYEFLLNYTNTSLEYWNMILDQFSLPHIDS